MGGVAEMVVTDRVHHDLHRIRGGRGDLMDAGASAGSAAPALARLVAVMVSLSRRLLAPHVSRTRPLLAGPGAAVGRPLPLRVVYETGPGEE